MNASFRSFAASLCTLAAALSGPGAVAAPRAIETFDGTTWQALQGALERPAVVVFSTTDCVHCPAVMEALSREIRARKLNATLVAVVMDIAPGDADAALMRDAHYRRADRLFAFAGQAPALRYAVDPGWRGVTPFVAFLLPHQTPVSVAGPPSAHVIETWAKATSSMTRAARR